MEYIYPYIPEDYFDAVMYACWYIRKCHSMPKAIHYTSEKFNVDPNILKEHILKRIQAGRKHKHPPKNPSKKRHKAGMFKTSNPYFNQLAETIVNNSKAKDFDAAVFEWEISGFHRNEDGEICICGKNGIKNVYEIINEYTGSILKTIGSSCIKRFGRQDLTDLVNVIDKQNNLISASFTYKGLSNVPFNSEFYSKNLIKKMFDDGAFKPSKYNNNDPYNDYLFLIKMFNKRTPMSSNEYSKYYVLLKNYIYPWLKDSKNNLRRKYK